MGTAVNPAIELLVAQVDELERKANAYRVSVNVLCAQDGVPPIYPDAGGSGNGGGKPSSVASETEGRSHSPAPIRPDAFYGKPQQTAVREYLAFRKGANMGPAKPVEILQGLKDGGYQVQATTDDIALVGLRAMMRKRNTVFHKLPNGAWGLREWYPNAKPAKTATEKAGGFKDGTAPKDDADEAEDTDSDVDGGVTEAA